MTASSLRTRLRDGDVAVGSFQVLDSPMVAEIMALAGADFVLIDQEHGPLSARETMSYCMAIEHAGAAPIVRVRDNRASEIQRALDVGATGVQVPQIETVADAEAAAAASRFAPIGRRGLNPYVRAGRYGSLPEYPERQNEQVLTIIHVEGTEAIDNLDDILEIEGIDVVFLGPYDLSQSLGIPGQVTDERVVGAMEAACERAKTAGKVVGAYADDADAARTWIDLGVQYVAVYIDASLLRDAYESLLAEVA